MKGQETRGFQSEVKQLLHLMIHSLYSNKEIFLRELISNASDAADKLRFRALSSPELYEGDGNLHVRISADKEKRTLTLSDNGIGMTRDEVIDNLGTIAKSGTKAFLESIGSDQAKDSQLIGQFGVGFYSAFIVADKVTVRTRSAGANADQAVFWESEGEGDYTIADIEKVERGTEITLHLREGEDEFLDDWRLRNIISKYSDHIALPVEILTTEGEDGEQKWEKSTRRRLCGRVPSLKLPTKSTKSSTSTLPMTLPIQSLGAITALKVSRNTPACCTFLRRHRGICSIATISTG